MMYNNKLAVAMKSAGKVLREFGETVYVPFGSEYSVLIKNLNSVRALVKIEIDGVDVGDGTKFIVDDNDSIELERFINNGNLKKGNRFKFIERTDSVEQHRGVGVEDGLIRIEFNFEKPQIVFNHDNWNSPIWTDNNHYGNSGKIRGVTQQDVYFSTSANTKSRQLTSNSVAGNVNVSSNTTRDVNDAGITVPGSVSDQQFRTSSSFPVESETHVIVLQMLGQTEDNQQVTKPITVKAKPKCTTCGRTNKATAKFCTECGTSLTIV